MLKNKKFIKSKLLLKIIVPSFEGTIFVYKDDFMKKIIAALLATIAFAAALTGCGGNKNNSQNESSAQSSASSENSKKNESSSGKSEMESKAESMMDDAENNGRVRDGDGIIGNEDYENRDDSLTDGVEDYVEGRMENGSTLADDAIF